MTNQVAALKKIRDSNKNGRWWIKADACDMRRGLRESMRHEWAGDSDLGDGELEALYQEYMNKRGFYSGLGIKERRQQVEADLRLVISGLDLDLKMLEDGDKEANEKYATKQRQSNASEDSLFALAWECEGYKTLLNMNKELKSYTTSLHSRISANLTGGNIAGDLSNLRKRLIQYVQSLYSKKRDAASHLMVFMIADEKRDLKPYVVPVRFLPYHSVTDNRLRELRDELRTTMVNLGMVVVGELLISHNIKHTM